MSLNGKKMKTIEEEKQFVEEIGIIIENLGGQPLLSRVISLLIIRMPEGITFEEIVEFLGASKSSISSTLNFLLQMKRITYFTKPGDRKRYFQIPVSEFWLTDIEKKIQEVDSIILMIEKVKKFKKYENNKLEEYLDNHLILMQRLQKMALNEIEKFKVEINKAKE